jgi:uncharacterized protein YdeI (YjbR/CyaY-like superfamily)
MKISNTVYIKNRYEWRKWLEENHQTEKEIWLVYYKKHTGLPRVPYNDAVEEALCFGWIDSNIQRIDEEKYVQKFTPRKNNSKWSELNIKRLRKLISEGKMTEAGMSKLNLELVNKDYKAHPTVENLEIPDFFSLALQENELARNNFNNLAPSYRRNYILWLSNAKTDETRRKRLEEAMGLLSENKKLGMK